MILPQVQTLRDILDADCSAVFVQPERLPGMLDILKEAPRSSEPSVKWSRKRYR